MATLPDLDAAVYTKLSGGSAIIALVSTRIYESQAPAGAALPYILFYAPSNIHPNDTPRDDINSIYRVEVVASTRASAQGVVAAVYSVMHEAAISVSGWSNYQCMCVGDIRLPVEQVNGLQYHRKVSEYRIRIARD